MVAVTSVIVGIRHRKDMGNIDVLAASIKDVGLLHPIVITPDNVLVAGERRLEAVKQLGWDEVPATVVPLEDIVRGEYAENAIRENFRPSEIDAIRRALHDLVATPHGGDRTSKSESFAFEGKTLGKTSDKIGAFAGVSGRTVEKIQRVVEAAETNPEQFSSLVEEMDRTGRVDGVYKKLRKKQVERRKNAIPENLAEITDRYRLICSDIADVKIESESIDCIITDPPYPEEFIDCYRMLAMRAAEWLKPGGSLLAMAGQTHLPRVIGALCSGSLQYHWVLSYLTLGGQSVQIFPRKINTFWKPVIWLTKGEYSGDWVGDVAKSANNDKRFHDWGQSESGMADIVQRVTLPGQTICDPFCGGGTTGVVAVAMNRSFVGVDIDKSAITTTAARLQEVADANMG